MSKTIFAEIYPLILRKSTLYLPQRQQDRFHGYVLFHFLKRISLKGINLKDMDLEDYRPGG